MAVAVIRMIASVGSNIFGSSTFLFSLPSDCFHWRCSFQIHKIVCIISTTDNFILKEILPF